MSPKRTKTIGGRIVKEFYWAGEYPVYVDHRFTPGSFEARSPKRKHAGRSKGRRRIA